MRKKKKSIAQEPEPEKMPSSTRRARSVGNEFRIIGKRIGAGNFGEVYLGENVANGKKVAVKVEKDAQPKSGARQGTFPGCSGLFSCCFVVLYGSTRWV